MGNRFTTPTPTLSPTPTLRPTNEYLFKPVPTPTPTPSPTATCSSNRDCIRDVEFCYFDPISSCGRGGGPPGLCKSRPESCPTQDSEEERIWEGCDNLKYKSECLMNARGVSMKSCRGNDHLCWGSYGKCLECPTPYGNVWTCLPDNMICD